MGLGNPGQQYQKTRHNVGFLFLDRLMESCGASWMLEPKFHALVANCFIGNHKVTLLKPQAFMNRSGLAVGAIARYYKLKAEEVLVVHDELDLNPGVVKLKKSGGHAGHNGLRDIIAGLGGSDFYRIRLGIGRPAPGMQVADYVLSTPTKAERGEIEMAFVLVDQQLNHIVSGDIATAMNVVNKARDQ